MNANFDETKTKLEDITGKKMASSIESLKKDWQDFYREVFKMEADFSKLEIPKKQEGFDKLLVMAEGLDTQGILAKCKEFFQTIGINPSQVVDRERNIKSAYAVWVRDRIEADEENENLSTNKIKEIGMSTQTLRERLLQELEYFKKTGQHLDVKNWTLCAGSHGVVGSVPGVDWRSDDDGLGVTWFVPGYSDSHLRARQVIS